MPRDGAVVESYAYDAEDHLTSAGQAGYTYDLDGFLTGKTVGAATTQYQYSSRGELLRVDLPSGGVVEYAHDPLGRRIAKKVGGTVVEKYLWQGRTKLLAVYDGNGSLKQRFEYADGRLPVAMTVGGTRYFLVYDQVGSLRAVVDSAGAAVKTVEYDSFGNVIADSNSAFAVPFGFAGGLFDSDTGLTRFGYRDYDADVGRWTAKDPIGFEGGDTDLYGYVIGDPVNGVDSEGEQAQLVAPAMRMGLPLLLGAAKAAMDGIKGGKKQSKGCSSSNTGDPGSSNPNDNQNDQDKGDEPASEQTAKDYAKQIERDLGEDARRDFHDMKEFGRDRSRQELWEHAQELYGQSGKTPPNWMKPGTGR